MASIGSITPTRQNQTLPILAPPIVTAQATPAAAAPNAARPSYDTLEITPAPLPQPAVAQVPKARSGCNQWAQSTWIAVCTKLFGRR